MKIEFVDYKEDSQNALQSGFEKLFDAVKVTPYGRNVVLDKMYGNKQGIKVGDKITREIELVSSLKNIITM